MAALNARGEIGRVIDKTAVEQVDGPNALKERSERPGGGAAVVSRDLRSSRLAADDGVAAGRPWRMPMMVMRSDRAQGVVAKAVRPDRAFPQSALRPFRALRRPRPARPSQSGPSDRFGSAALRRWSRGDDIIGHLSMPSAGGAGSTEIAGGSMLRGMPPCGASIASGSVWRRTPACHEAPKREERRTRRYLRVKILLTASHFGKRLSGKVSSMVR